MAASPNKIVQRLAACYNNEFTRQQYTKYFFKNDYGFQAIDKHWSSMINKGIIIRSTGENGYPKTNDQSESLWKLDL